MQEGLLGPELTSLIKMLNCENPPPQTLKSTCGGRGWGRTGLRPAAWKEHGPYCPQLVGGIPA